MPNEDFDLLAEELSVAPAVGAAKNAAPEKGEPKKVDHEEDEEVPGVTTVTFGTKVSNVAVPKFRGIKDYKARIAILSKNAQAAKVHYVDGIGSFLCFGGKCCENEGFPRVKYLVPVVQYETDRNGKIVGDKVEVKVLPLGGDTYSALADTVSLSGRKITDVDIIVSCSDENYQKLTFAADSSGPASWRKFACADEVINFYKANKNKLYQAVGRVINESTYLAKKGVTVVESAPTTITMQAPDLDDLLD